MARTASVLPPFFPVAVAACYALMVALSAVREQRSAVFDQSGFRRKADARALDGVAEWSSVVPLAAMMCVVMVFFSFFLLLGLGSVAA